MAKARSPNREKAFAVWQASGGKTPLTRIAEQLEVSDSQIRKWKSVDDWEGRLNGNGVTIGDGAVTGGLNGNRLRQKKAGPPFGSQNAKGHGAPRGNRNAVGNRGGGAMPGNRNAERHGFFARIFPDDAETRAIIESIALKRPLEMLWDNIVIQYTAIARAQKLMFVRNQEDLSKELKQRKVREFEQAVGGKPEAQAGYCEEAYALQFAWDKHATLLRAQSAAMKTLEGLLARYDELSRGELATEEQRARIDKLRAEITRISGDGAGQAAMIQFVDDIGSDDDAGG